MTPLVIVAACLGLVVLGVGGALAVLRIRQRRRRAILRRMLLDVCEVMDAASIPYWVDFGSLLGASRDGDIILWDRDADLGTWAECRSMIVERCREPLAARGHTLIVMNSWLRVGSASWPSYRLDLYMYERRGEFARHLFNREPMDIPVALVEETTLMPFHGRMIRVPVRTQDVLKFRYGDDYLTPIAGYIGREDGFRLPHSALWHWFKRYL